MLHGVGVFDAAIAVEALDLDGRARDLARPLGAVADEDDALVFLRGNGALVGAEDDVEPRDVGVAVLVELPKDLDGLFDGAGTAAPAVVGALGLGGRACVGRDVRALEVLLDADETDLEAERSHLRLFERDVAGDVDLVEIDGPEAALVGHADVVDRARVEADDGRANSVEGDLAVAHDDEVQAARDGREHAPLAGFDGVDGDEFRLHDVLQIRDLLVEAVIVIDEPMPVVLNPDVVLQREGDGGPRVGLELRTVHEEVALRDGLRGEQVVA